MIEKPEKAPENRITDVGTGNNTDLFMNFKPKMDQIDLLAGYKTIISNIYGIKPYYKRIRQLLLNYNCIKLCSYDGILRARINTAGL